MIDITFIKRNPILTVRKGTQLSIGTTEPNPCGQVPQYYTQVPFTATKITYELAGNTTTTIPQNKTGITIDSQVQINRAQKLQELVTEKNTVQVPVAFIKEDAKATAYLQKDDRPLVEQQLINYAKID